MFNGVESIRIYFTSSITLSLRILVLDSSIISIGNNALSGCGALQSVTIPDSVTRIGTNLAVHCSL